MSSNNTLAKSRIAVLGYGSQGRAHAMWDLARVLLLLMR